MRQCALCQDYQPCKDRAGFFTFPLALVPHPRAKHGAADPKLGGGSRADRLHAWLSVPLPANPRLCGSGNFLNLSVPQFPQLRCGEILVPLPGAQ